MSDLVVVGFSDEKRAEVVLEELQSLDKDYLVDLADAAVISRSAKGKLKVVTTDNLTGKGALSGVFWGALVGLLFLAPLGGAAIGGAIGAAIGRSKDLGIKEDFKRELGQLIQPGTSGIMAVLRSFGPDRVLVAIDPYGGESIQTELSPEAETEMLKVLHGEEAA